MAWRLAETKGFVTRNEFLNALYQHREDGGPLDLNTVSVFLMHIRASFSSFGIEIILKYKFGWCIKDEDREFLRELLVEEVQINVIDREIGSCTSR
jgi:hypothetical protein